MRGSGGTTGGRPTWPARRPRIGAAAATLLATSLVAGAAGAFQAAPPDRIADGGFEDGTISLALADVDRFPLFANGWATRGTPVPRPVSSSSFEGDLALRIVSHAGAPVQALQDVPLATTGFRLAGAFKVEEGLQRLALLADWDRRFPVDGAELLALELSPGEIRLEIGAVSRALEISLTRGGWHSFALTADPRDGLTELSFDGAPLITIATSPRRPPTTLLLEGSATGSRFLWDDLRLVGLAEEELERLEHRAAALDPARHSPLTARLRVAADALRRGAPIFALPELHAARRQLERIGTQADLPLHLGVGARTADRDERAASSTTVEITRVLDLDSVRAGLDRLIALVAADVDRLEARR